MSKLVEQKRQLLGEGLAYLGPKRCIVLVGAPGKTDLHFLSLELLFVLPALRSSAEIASGADLYGP